MNGLALITVEVTITTSATPGSRLAGQNTRRQTPWHMP
jgi:hypothetical protein